MLTGASWRQQVGLKMPRGITAAADRQEAQQAETQNTWEVSLWPSATSGRVHYMHWSKTETPSRPYRLVWPAMPSCVLCLLVTRDVHEHRWLERTGVKYVAVSSLFRIKTISLLPSNSNYKRRGFSWCAELIHSDCIPLSSMCIPYCKRSVPGH